MTKNLDYRWNLRQVMATREMFATTDLLGPLAERGIRLSSSQVYRLVVDRPEWLSLKILMALLDILDCSMEELIEPVATPQPRRNITNQEPPSRGSYTGSGTPPRRRHRVAQAEACADHLSASALLLDPLDSITAAVRSADSSLEQLAVRRVLEEVSGGRAKTTSPRGRARRGPVGAHHRSLAGPEGRR